MASTANLKCIEIRVPKDMPMRMYRQHITERVKRILMENKLLNRFIKEEPVPELVGGPGDICICDMMLTITTACGCVGNFLVKDIPLESLTCPCGKQYFFKITKV